MKPLIDQLSQAVRDVLRITFVTPVREGRPHPSAWPRGLKEVGLACAVVFGLLALAILLAGPLRRYDGLAMASTTPVGLPQVSVPVLFTGVILSLALAVTAALHTSWWLRIILVVVAGAALPGPSYSSSGRMRRWRRSPSPGTPSTTTTRPRSGAACSAL